jgi:hypothetical protein
LAGRINPEGWRLQTFLLARTAISRVRRRRNNDFSPASIAVVLLDAAWTLVESAETL